MISRRKSTNRWSATTREIVANCLWLHPDGLAIVKGDRDVLARDVLVRGGVERGERGRAPSVVEAPQCTEDMQPTQNQTKPNQTIQTNQIFLIPILSLNP